MLIIIRQETFTDHNEVFQVVEKAFRNEKYSDKKEQFLVAKLRKSKAFIPELSLVAVFQKEIVGHILLTKLKIVDKSTTVNSLSLAPISVKPEFQRKGIGESLIIKAHKIAIELGYRSIIVLGHENYYPKFGYKIIDKDHIFIPFDVPNENCMIISLTKDGLNGLSGKVEYPVEFFEKSQ
jgi:predicted N-acetyltransferase YhbS